jgi:hypothetical protein
MILCHSIWKKNSLKSQKIYNALKNQDNFLPQFISASIMPKVSFFQDKDSSVFDS